MDSAAPSTATSSTNILSKLAPSKRILFLATYRRTQAWSLPKPIIRYMAKHTSSTKCYEKLIKSSKYFFLINPILVVKNFSMDYEEDEWCTYFNHDLVDLQSCTSKIWVTGVFAIGDVIRRKSHQFPISFVTSKLYQLDMKHIFLSHENVAFDDLIWLASKCEFFTLNSTAVKDENDVFVALEKIIEALPNIKKFFCIMEKTGPNMVTSNTVQKLIKIPHFCNLSEFHLAYLPESFNVDQFYSYIKKNKQTKIHLHFNDHQNRLQEIINEIIQTEEHEYMVPMITFPGVDQASLKTLRRLHDTKFFSLLL